jgi:hypothetical protein
MGDLPSIVQVAESSGATAVALTALIKNPDLLKMIYEDVAQPSVQKVGQALSSVFGLANTLLLPLRLLNEKTEALFCSHMEQFRKNLDNHKAEEIHDIPTEIGIPIIDRLTYYQDINLVEFYLALLEQSAIGSHDRMVHPIFVSILNNVSPDEAILIKNIARYVSSRGKISIPFINVEAKRIKDYASRSLARFLVPHCLIESIHYKESLLVYLDNLISLGFFHTLNPDRWIADLDVYKPLSDEYRDMIDEFSGKIDNTEEKIQIENCFFVVSAIGMSLLKILFPEL